MSLKPIRNEQDYQRAKHLNITLMNEEPSSTRDDMLKVNAVLMENYVDKQVPQTFSDPIEAIEFYCNKKGYSQVELQKILGEDTNAVLNREKPLTKKMIWKLCHQWKIPAQPLIQAYSLRPVTSSSSVSCQPSPFLNGEE